MTTIARRSADRETIEAEIDRIRSLGLDELRMLWRTKLRSASPPAFTKDLVARFICWQIQEQALGRLDPATAKLLDGLARGGKPGADGPRRLKPGTVLVREYQGERHTVTVVPGGYVWGETTYTSLSTIARTITGTTWNGPRFFGLRVGGSRGEDTEGRQPVATARSIDAGRVRKGDGRVPPIARKPQR